MVKSLLLFLVNDSLTGVSYAGILDCQCHINTFRAVVSNSQLRNVVGVIEPVCVCVCVCVCV